MLNGFCQCADPFFGTYCEAFICDSIDCNENGLCVNRYGVSSCICLDGFTGTTCNIISQSNRKVIQDKKILERVRQIIGSKTRTTKKI